MNCLFGHRFQVATGELLHCRLGSPILQGLNGSSAGAALARFKDEPVPIRPGHTIVGGDGLQHPGRKALSLQLTRMVGRRLAQHHPREPSLGQHGEKRGGVRDEWLHPDDGRGDIGSPEAVPAGDPVRTLRVWR